ncbi:C2 domain-containing protein [Hygrophoropsis aurantiaca]|uniref:C2 domain-containing protein n=1 Tax=Hygrophoropsis aurantiaca TaxID=72124 RepID=A0ACB8APF9_9AGAM|nr:C2 domain-containing protein [Hygrophoropsis aurantiaca]
MSSNTPSNGVEQHQQAADAHVHGLLSHDAAKGAAVHSFHPDASPQEKSAAAGKGRDQLKSSNQQGGDSQGGKEVAIDTGNSGIVPTITVEDADKVAKEEREDTGQLGGSPPTATTPGSYPSSSINAIPDWYKVGWRAHANVDRPPLEQGEEKDKTILQLFFSEQYYGDWYHNAGIIIFAVFSSHFLTRFGFGWGWLFILLAICSTYYTTSMTRVRRRARDDIQRELVKTRLASEHESADWINNFLDRFWLIYEPVLSATVISSVDQILSTNTPAFLDSLRLSTFTLGTKAPRIDKVRTFPKTDDDVVMMDWGISFTPNDISDLTRRQAEEKVNPKIVLSVRLGKGLATAAMPILIEDISFSGLMRIRLKLMTNFPHVQIVDLSFLEKPVIDYVLKPVGGDTFGFDIAHVPGLSAFIREMVHATLGPMMYDPNVFTLNLEQLLSGTPLDAAIGVVQVTVEAARQLKGSKIGGGSPDPFVSININNREELARTKYKHSTFNPTWMESKFILVNSLQDSLMFNVIDYNGHRKDTPLGAATFDMQKLLDDATQENIELSILRDGKDKGQLRLSVNYFPVLKPETVDGKDQVPNSNVGIVRMTIHQAKELDHTKSLSGDLNPIGKLYLGDSKEATHRTQIIKHTNNPVWESATEFLCSDKTSSIVTLKVVDERDFLKDPVVGYMSVRLTDLLEAETAAGRDWWPLSGCKSGKVRITTEWKPLHMPGALSGVDQYVPPIGVVRLWLKKATDVKNVEAALGGKSDPYVRVQVNGRTQGRTEVINNNLNPEWDQIIYIPVHSIKESMFMEVMDYQHLTKDRSLGSVEVHIGDLIREASSTSEYRYESTGKKATEDPIQLDGSHIYKGQLHYEAEFVPALAIKGVRFDRNENELQRAVREDDGGADGDVASKSSSRSSSPSPLEERHVTVARPTTERDHIPAKSMDTINTVKTNGDTNGNAERSESSLSNRDGEKEDTGIELSREDLLKHQSGVIIFNVLSGQIRKKARLEVCLDDGYWPAFSTGRARGTHAQWQHVGEGFVKELDFGRVWLRLNENAEGEKDDIIAEWKGDTKAFLEATLDHPNTFTLTDDEDRTSSVEIEARYVPVPVKLEARESVNNQGTLRVELIEGKDIRAADRGGKSDPFAVFSLNGQKVFKSQTKKKTLNPDWQEDFPVNVTSRVAADFSVEVFDWNQVEQAKSLGVGTINLADIEPFQATERIILLTDKHGQKGQVHIRMTFRPEIIVKTRKNTSTFSAAGRAMTQFGALPMDAGKGVIHGVGSIFKKDSTRHAKDDDSLHVRTVSGQASQPVSQSQAMGENGPSAAAAAFPSMSGSATGNGGPPSDPGTLRVTILGAKDLSSGDIKPYAVVRIGDKEHKTKHTHKTATPEWNESFNCAAGPFTPKIHVWVYDHKTLGKDKMLGEGEVDVWRHLQLGKTSSADVFAELREGGLLRLRLEFDADTNPTARDPSIASSERPSRFSIRGRRPASDDN